MKRTLRDVATFDWRFVGALAFYRLLAKAERVHPWLPAKVRNRLPIDWNAKMLWTALRSGGTRIYNDYPSTLRTPTSFAPRVSVQEDYRLTEEDIRGFYENGYLGPFDVLGADEAEDLRQHLVGSVLASESKTWSFEFEDDAGLADILFPNSENDVELTEEFKQSVLPHIEKVNRHLDDERLLDVYRRPEILERCAQLLGPDLLLWKSDCFEVPAKEAGTPWHQASLWLLHNMRECAVHPPDDQELFQLTVWVALTDANRDRGCLRVIPGSHRDIYPTIVERDPSQVDQVYRYDKGALDYPFEGAPEHLLEAKAGQCFLFTERVVHGSVGNTTDEPRGGINARLARTDTKFYTENMFAEGHQYTYHKLRMNLANWRAVLLRGVDRYHHNRLDDASQSAMRRP